jgi:hypothetical protein
MKKVISASLFNKDHAAYYKYAVGAPRTARFMERSMPDWKFRLYYDNTAPMDIIKSLESFSNTELVECDRAKGRAGCFWRYLAFDDCDIAICRDLDFRIQENDIISINRWLQTDHKVLFNWFVHNRGARHKDKRYYQAGGVSARNLPFTVKHLIDEYPNKDRFGSDEVFLWEKFVPEVLKYEKKTFWLIEPRCRKFNTELFPDQEHYEYLDKDWAGI